MTAFAAPLLVRPPVAAALLALHLAGVACDRAESREANKRDSAEVAKRVARLTQALARPDSSPAPGAPIARWVLPEELAEISGLALTADGRLLGHDDERARVFEIDYRRGVLVKEFLVGDDLTADFEGIATTHDAIFLLASNGKLYEFPEGAAGERVDYTVHDTHLGRECEFEGVAYDRAINSLLLACKVVEESKLRGSLVIYRWKLERGSGPRVSHLAVPLARVIGSNGWKTLRPSDITVDPVRGTYVLVASQEKAIVELTPEGEVTFARPLPDKEGNAEGVAITTDGILIVSDEATKRPAVITLYRWPGPRS